MTLTHRVDIDERLTDLAVDAIGVLKTFLATTDDVPDPDVKRAKYASVALSAWAKWEQTSTARAALQATIEERGHRRMPLASGT